MGGMIPIFWTEQARADLRAVHAYIARDSRVYARRNAGNGPRLRPVLRVPLPYSAVVRQVRLAGGQWKILEDCERNLPLFSPGLPFQEGYSGCVWPPRARGRAPGCG